MEAGTKEWDIDMLDDLVYPRDSHLFQETLLSVNQEVDQEECYGRISCY